jgi:hypothetical protein
MKRIFLSLLASPMLLCAQSPAPAAAPAAAGVSGGGIFVGTRGLDNSGWMGRVNEYEMNKQGLRPAVRNEYWYVRDSWFFNFTGENRGDSRASVYQIDADLDRKIRIRSDLERFMHRLEHDPLANLDAAKGNVVVRHDNLAPDRAFVPGRNELRTDIVGRINSWIEWRAAHRYLQIHGETQTRSLSKCANCHSVAEATRINQKLHDVSAGLTVRFGRRVQLLYDYTNRQFKEHGATPTAQYDVAQHPSTLSRAFFNRVQFDGTTNGEMPYALVPGFRKDMHNVRLVAELPRDGRLTGQYLHTNARNNHVRTDLSVDVWNARYTMPLTSRLSLKAQVRRTDMTNDDIFIQLEEPANPAGVPQAGQTYAQAYPAFGSVDWTRNSAINRTDWTAGTELSARLARLTTLRSGWQFRSIRRDHFEVERTDRNRFFAVLSARPEKSWNARLRYYLDLTDHPFLHHKAALSPEMQPFASPGNPPSPLAGLQYFSMYAARQADLTNQPTRSHLVEPSFTWTPSPRAALTVHYRANLQLNDKLNFSRWERSLHMPGAELWLAPTDKFNFTVGYTWQRDLSDTLFVIPVFDG